MKMTADILAKYDPMGLISAGAPQDEYEHEAVNIVLAILPIPIEGDIVLHCRGVFRTCFAGVMNEKFDWTPVAKEILKVFL